MARPRSRSSLDFYPFHYFHCSRDGLEDPPNRCEDCIYEWHHSGGGVHRAATGLWDAWEGVPCMQVKEGTLWLEAGSENLVFTD